MNSWLNSCASRCGRLIPAALVLTTLGLFVATGMLYVSQSQQRELLAVSVRTSGWVAYQAQLEYVKSHAAIQVAIADPSEANLEELSLRLEILLSRMPILYDSEEGKLLSGMDAFQDEVRIFEDKIDGFIATIPILEPGTAEASAVISGWHEEIEPLGTKLQQILQTSVAYNAELYRREQELSASVATLPLILMFVSGASLVGLLLVQNARDRGRLQQVTQAKAREAAIRDDFHAAIEAIPAVIAIIDPETDEVNFINVAAAEVISPARDAPEWRRLAQVILTDTPSQTSGVLNIGFPREDGRITSLRGARRPVIWEGKPQELVALADTTQIRAAELQVMQSAKLATLGEMASAIAHELNQPLSVIKMASTNVRRLVENGAPHDAIVAKVQRIESQIDRAKRITDQVRRYARAPSAIAARFPLRSAVELAAGFVSEQYRAAGIRLEMSIDFPGELTVLGEQTMFEQTIVNLLVNARDALEEHGSADGSRRVMICGRIEGEHVVIEVADNAGGIAPEVLDRLFDAFTTTKSAEKGTGLGLSLARTVVTNMDGSISAANVGEGACFTIRLPIPAEGASEKEVA